MILSAHLLRRGRALGQHTWMAALEKLSVLPETFCDCGFLPKRNQAGRDHAVGLLFIATWKPKLGKEAIQGSYMPLPTG